MSKVMRLASALSAFALAFALIGGDIARSYGAALATIAVKKPW